MSYNWPEDIKITYEQYRYFMFKYCFDLFDADNPEEEKRIKRELDKELEAIGASYEDITKSMRAIWYM